MTRVVCNRYLQVEWDLKKGTPRNMIKTVRGGCPKVPQQTNFSDCGVFVLQYIESFFEVSGDFRRVFVLCSLVCLIGGDAWRAVESKSEVY